MEENKGRHAVRDMIVGIVIALFGIYVIVTALNMKVYNTFIDSPGFFPLIIGIVMLVLGGILAIIGFKAGGVTELKEVCSVTFIKNFFKDERTQRVIILFGMMVIYVFVLLGRIPFILSTSIYLTATFLYLKACKHWWMSIIIAVVVATVVYFVFRYGFGITMP